ncbi:hypothetical protein ACIP1T_19965 [Pseudomonas japonica]|uniref:hypothetical protein n=1 Tax=Pseudomonas japonica TaxID=256466 RepID=UPI0038111D61
MKRLDKCPQATVIQHNVLMALDSLRSNLACEVTDNILRSLPLSAHYGLYRMLMAVAAGTTLARLHDHASRRDIDFPDAHLVTNRGAGLLHRQISRMNDLFPYTRIRTRHGLPVEQPQRPGHRREGLATWQLPAAITFKTTLPGTGSGRVAFVPLQRGACNEQRGVAG